MNKEATATEIKEEMHVTMLTALKETVTKKLKSFNKKAEKLGQEPLQYSFSESRIESIQNNYINMLSGEHDSQLVYKEVCTLKVVNPYTLKISDSYEIIAKLDHTYGELNKVTFYNNDFVTAEYIDMWEHKENHCDHCNTNRRRKTTYIVREENGELKQIGRNCLSIYFGIDIEAKINMMDLLESTIFWCENLEADDEVMKCVNFEYFYNIHDILTLTKKFLEKHEYISKNRAYEAMERGNKIKTTAEEITELYQRTNEEIEQQDFTDMINYYKSEEAGNSDYILNLRTIINHEYIKEKDIALVISAIPSYSRYLDKKAREAKRAEEAEKSEYVGNVGDKLKDIHLIVNKCITYETDWGTGCLWLMEDKEGHIYKWSTSTANLLDEGNNVVLNASIKAHDEYRGEKQTVLTRCKMNYVESIKTMIENKQLEQIYNILRSLDNYATSKQIRETFKFIKTSKEILNMLKEKTADNSILILEEEKYLYTDRKNNYSAEALADKKFQYIDL